MNAHHRSMKCTAVHTITLTQLAAAAFIAAACITIGLTASHPRTTAPGIGVPSVAARGSTDGSGTDQRRLAWDHQIGGTRLIERACAGNRQ